MDTTELDGQETPLGVIGDYAIELVDRIKEDYGEDFKLGEVVIVAEVEHEGTTYIEPISSEHRIYVTKAIVKQAMRNIVETAALDYLSEDEDE